MKTTQSPRGYAAGRTYRVRTKSGVQGWRCRLRANYDDSLSQFQAYADAYNLVARLGYPNAEAAWKANPVIEGSVNPGDFRMVRA